MKQSIKQNGQNLFQKQRIERSSMEVTTKSSHTESYFFTHSNPPLSIIIPVLYHSSNWMRSLPASSRIAEIQTNNQSFSSNPTVSIPPCKPKAASLNQFSVCRWVLTSRWIIPSKQTTETPKHFLPSFLPCCMISSVEYKDPTFTLTLFHFLFSSHSIHSKIKWKTDSHIHIVFSPNNFTLLFILLEILFIPFLSNNHTQYSKNTMEPLLDIFLFHSLQRLVQFSSVTSWHGFCLTISLMGSLGVLGCVSTLHPNSIMNTLRRFGAAVRLIFPLRAVALAGRFRLDAFTSNLCKSRRITRNQSTTNPNDRQEGSRAWRNCGKSSLQSEYLWHSANRNTLRPICANFPFFASNWIS